MGTVGLVCRYVQERITVKDEDILLPQRKESIDVVEIMPQERVQIVAVDQTVDAPTLQVDEAEAVRRTPRVCTSERIVEQTVEFLVSSQERTQHLVRPQAYVNRRR